MLALSSGRREETLLALSATSYTWWVVRIVYTSHITLNLSTPTWYARLVDAFVLRRSLWLLLLLLSGRRAAGSIRALWMQWILGRCGRHRQSSELSRLDNRCASLSHGLGCKRLAAEVGKVHKDPSETMPQGLSCFSARAGPFWHLGKG